MMTENEFDVLDELYFLQSYQYLLNTLQIEDDILKSTLQELISKGWVRCYITPSDEVEFNRSTFEKEYKDYHYLASKAGLLAHNSIS
jgi:hypothetical protein